MSQDHNDLKKGCKKTAEGVNGFIKGNKLYNVNQGYKYSIKLASKSNKVSIMDMTAISAKKGGKVKGDWILRLDKPHKGAEFNHININPGISGINDPHIPLPPGALTSGKGVAKFCKVVNKVNKVAIPLAIAMDAVQTGVSVYEDYENGTSRNTVETLAGVAGGWAGGYGGAIGGAAIGTAILPGIGTIIGGIVGGIGGGIGGSLGAGYAVDAIGDACDYDIIEKKCKKCGKNFKVRQYRGEENGELCQKCA